MGFNVAFQAAFLYKCLPANTACKPSIIVMYPHMLFQGFLPSIGFLADFTLVYPFPVMFYHVHGHLGIGKRVIRANLALVVAFFQVRLFQMPRQRILSIEHFPAHIARILQFGNTVILLQMALPFEVFRESHVTVRAFEPFSHIMDRLYVIFQFLLRIEPLTAFRTHKVATNMHAFHVSFQPGFGNERYIAFGAHIVTVMRIHVTFRRAKRFKTKFTHLANVGVARC